MGAPRCSLGLLAAAWLVPALALAEAPAPSGRAASSRTTSGAEARVRAAAKGARRVGHDPAWEAVWAAFARAFRENRPGDLLRLAAYPVACGERRELVLRDEVALREKLTGPGGCLPFTDLEALGEGGDASLNNLGMDRRTGYVTTAITMGEGVDCADWVWAHFERRGGAYLLRRLWTTRACGGGGD